eukprot:197904-Rhodomonas_salina.1
MPGIRVLISVLGCMYVRGPYIGSQSCMCGGLISVLSGVCGCLISAGRQVPLPHPQRPPDLPPRVRLPFCSQRCRSADNYGESVDICSASVDIRAEKRCHLGQQESPFTDLQRAGVVQVRPVSISYLKFLGVSYTVSPITSKMFLGGLLDEVLLGWYCAGLRGTDVMT